MDLPLVSIIIPTFNRENLISRAVQSIISQTFTNYELIIVDDGSNDNTDKTIGKFKDHRIRYFKQEINQGQNAALNYGISISRGKYIAFLDSDDEWLPEFLEKNLALFNQDQSLGAVYSRAFGCSNTGELFEGYPFSLQGNVYKEALQQGYLSYMITIIVRREVVDMLKPHPFDPEFVYGQDDDFCFRVCKMCKIGLIKEPLAIIHNDGDLHGSEPSICKNTIMIAAGKEKLLKKYKDDILELCGKPILASKYLSLGKIYLRNDNYMMAKASLINSFKYKKSFKTLLFLVYSRSNLIRRIFDFILNIYRQIKTLIKRTIH